MIYCQPIRRCLHSPVICPGTAIFLVSYRRNSYVIAPCNAGYAAHYVYLTGENHTMTLAPEIEAKILRYYHVEKWRNGTIARQLHIHHSSVERVLRQAGLPRIGKTRLSRIDPYLPFIRQTLEKFPSLTASRLHVMVRERGYTGSADHCRHLISHHRPRPQAEAYLRLVTLPGEQAQVDWGHFCHLTTWRARRPLVARRMR